MVLDHMKKDDPWDLSTLRQNLPSLRRCLSCRFDNEEGLVAFAYGGETSLEHQSMALICLHVLRIQRAMGWILRQALFSLPEWRDTLKIQLSSPIWAHLVFTRQNVVKPTQIGSEEMNAATILGLIASVCSQPVPAPPSGELLDALARSVNHFILPHGEWRCGGDSDSRLWERIIADWDLNKQNSQSILTHMELGDFNGNRPLWYLHQPQGPGRLFRERMLIAPFDEGREQP